MGALANLQMGYAVVIGDFESKARGQPVILCCLRRV